MTNNYNRYNLPAIVSIDNDYFHSHIPHRIVSVIALIGYEQNWKQLVYWCIAYTIGYNRNTELRRRSR